MELNQCTYPWFELQLRHDGCVRTCCYHVGPDDYWDSETTLQIDQYWNGEKIKKIREGIIANNPLNTGCRNCQMLRYNDSFPFAQSPYNLNSIQKNNWERAFKNYKNQKITVDSYPVKYYLSFGLACNLKCIMCSQRDMRLSDNRQLNIRNLLIQKEYLIKADSIHIIGGEPFFLPSVQQFINEIKKDPDYENVELVFYTNATLLHKYIEQLKCIKRVRIVVSLDSIGDAYEYIRRGASWKQTEHNILSFLEIGQRNNLDWNINVAGIIMKSSIPKLMEFINWSLGHRIPCHFVPLVPMQHTKNEDIYTYPHLLRTIPDWEVILDKAIQKLTQERNINVSAHPLIQIRDELTKKVSNQEKCYLAQIKYELLNCQNENKINRLKKEIQPMVEMLIMEYLKPIIEPVLTTSNADCPERWQDRKNTFINLLNNQSLKLIVFGTGSGYSKFIAPVLQVIGVEPAYFIDNDLQKINQTINGIIVLPVDSLVAEEHNKILILVASATFYGQMKQQLESLGLVEDKDFFYALREELFFLHQHIMFENV